MKIWGMGRSRKNLNTATANRRLRIEQLEDKRLLAVVWANEFGANGFNTYGTNEVYARETVSRAIDDWNAVVTDQNFDNDGDSQTNDFLITISAFDFATINSPDVRGDAGITQFTHGGAGQVGWEVGVPSAATIRIDNDGGGSGWFFDVTPRDDVEFTSIAGDFAASFVDVDAVAQARRDDLYRTVTHEIGHALGITSDSQAAIAGMLTDLVDGNGSPVRYLGLSNQNQLQRFDSTRANPTYNVTATFNGGHIYEGSDIYLLEGVAGVQPDPVTVFEQGSPATPLAFQSHPNDLVNSGITVPGGAFNPENETVRQWISDLDAMILADAYGYTVTLPSTLDSAHVMLDQYTGTLLVQGSARNTKEEVLNDSFDINRVGDDLVVVVTTPKGTFTERVPYDDVTEILVNGNDPVFMADPITVGQNVGQPVTRLAYVVSTNEDVLESSTSVSGAGSDNGIVDISSVVPGSQTPLRAAILEANALPGIRPIYVGRGIYNLTLTTQGGLDITGNATILGAGAGLTVIDASAVGDRVFQVTGTLDLSRVTVTGGNTTDDFGGAGIYVQSGGSLDLNQSAIVGNTAKNLAGGIRNQGTTVINRSVITKNHLENTLLTDNGGGGLYSDVVDLTIGSTIVAENTADFGEKDINNGSAAAFVSLGSNLLSSLPANLVGVFDEPGDRVAAIKRVVTSLGDMSDTNDNGFALTLREALAAVNFDNSADMEVVAVPGWSFVVDHFLEVSENTSLQGVGAAFTSVVTTHPNGVVFAVAGDIDRNGMIGQTDFDFVLLNWGSSLGNLNRPQDEAAWALYFSTDGVNNDIKVDMSEQDGVLLGWGFGLEDNVENYLTGIIDISWTPPS